MVLVTCPTPIADITIVPGFNHMDVRASQHKIISMGSCTGNCAVPILSVIEEKFGKGSIRGLYAVAPHSKTNTQELGDKGASPKQQGLLGNMVPTPTGLTQLLQQPGFFDVATGSVEALSVRVPTEDVSLLCMNVDVEDKGSATTEGLCTAFSEASRSPRWTDILGYTTITAAQDHLDGVLHG